MSVDALTRLWLVLLRYQCELARLIQRLETAAVAPWLILYGNGCHTGRLACCCFLAYIAIYCSELCLVSSVLIWSSFGPWYPVCDFVTFIRTHTRMTHSAWQAVVAELNNEHRLVKQAPIWCDCMIVTALHTLQTLLRLLSLVTHLSLIAVLEPMENTAHATTCCSC